MFADKRILKELYVKLPELHNLWKKELSEIKHLTWKKINGEWFTETSTLKATIIKTNKHKKYKPFNKFGKYLLIYYLKGFRKYNFKMIAPNLNLIKQWFKRNMMIAFSETNTWIPPDNIKRKGGL